jgi:hypothetical protein
MARFTVLGFTEAELGFTLAALFVALSGYQIVEATGSADVAAQATDSVRVMQDQLAVAKQEIDSLKRLTSRLTPYCSERGETSANIARVTVVSATRYRIDRIEGVAEPPRVEVPLSGLTERLSGWLEIGKAKRCRFGIEVVPGAGLTADTFMRARDPLSRIFYFR